MTTPDGVARSDRRFEAVEDKLRHDVRDAYLEPWTTYEPMDRLLEAFELSRKLSPLFVATWEIVELPYLDPSSPWAKHVLDGILLGRGGKPRSVYQQLLEYNAE